MEQGYSGQRTEESVMLYRIAFVLAGLTMLGISTAQASPRWKGNVRFVPFPRGIVVMEPRVCMETWSGAEHECARFIYRYASDHLDAGHFDEAIMRFTQVLSIKPYLFAYNGRAAAYAKKGDYFRARRDYVRALGISQSFPESWYNLAWVDYKEKNFKEALDNVSMAIKLRADAPDYYDLRALIYKAMGDHRRAALDTASSWLLRTKDDSKREKQEHTTLVE
jgi:tetratricopeptide (TPR) repeat protein